MFYTFSLMDLGKPCMFVCLGLGVFVCVCVCVFLCVRVCIDLYLCIGISLEKSSAILCKKAQLYSDCYKSQFNSQCLLSH